MPIAISPAGAPVYARFTFNPKGLEKNDHRILKTSVYSDYEHPDILVICTSNNKYQSEYRPTRMTLEQAMMLRNALNEHIEACTGNVTEDVTENASATE